MCNLAHLPASGSDRRGRPSLTSRGWPTAPPRIRAGRVTVELDLEVPEADHPARAERVVGREVTRVVIETLTRQEAKAQRDRLVRDLADEHGTADRADLRALALSGELNFEQIAAIERLELLDHLTRPSAVVSSTTWPT